MNAQRQKKCLDRRALHGAGLSSFGSIFATYYQRLIARGLFSDMGETPMPRGTGVPLVILKSISEQPWG